VENAGSRVIVTERAMLDRVPSVCPDAGGGRAVSFLPAAHIADRWSSHYGGMVHGLTHGRTSISRASSSSSAGRSSRESGPGGVDLTPTMKLRRRPIAERYAAEIEAQYAG
jgi:long-subunit acyl-CoA synthetase (AMP-forming)